jgi:hypothetical protein
VDFYEWLNHRIIELTDKSNWRIEDRPRKPKIAMNFKEEEPDSDSKRKNKDDSHAPA